MRVKQIKQLAELSMMLAGDPASVFARVVRMIGELFEVRVVCLSQIAGTELIFRAVYVNGQVLDDAGTCPLSVTPCSTVQADGSLRMYERVQELFPEATFLRAHNAFSYCGFPALDDEGQVVAVTCLLDDKPHEFTEEDQTILKLIGQRIAMEIQRARSIEERSRTEKTVRESEERYQRIVETAEEGIWMIDARQQTSFVNPALARMLGYAVEEMIGRPLHDFMNEAGRAVCDENVRRREQGIAEQHEFQFQRKDGSALWANLSTNPIYDASGIYAGALAMITDIAQRKQGEVALRQSEESFRTLAANLPDVVVRFDRQRRHLYANPAVFDATGIPPEAFIGKTNEELGMPEEMVAVWKATLERVFVTGNVERLEFKYPGPAGKKYWESHVVAEYGPDGTIESALVLSRDITKLRQTELALHEALSRFQKIACQLPGVVYQYRMRPDGSSCFPFASDAIRQIYRCSPEEVREDASKVFSILHPEDYDSIVASIQDSARHLTPWRCEYRVKFDDGTIRWLFGNSLPQREADGSTLWHGFITDITERKQIEIEREKLDQKMQETQKLESLGVLAGGIAHDFNNLLTVILGNASIAARELPAGSAAQNSLEQIIEASHRAADLCKQMLAYSGRGRFVVQTVDLGQLVESTAQMLQISISKKAVLCFHLKADLPPVNVDATQIRQIIMNLVINASEAIGDQSGVISVSTGLTRVNCAGFEGILLDASLSEGEYAYLEVSDTGCGMTMETQAKIFDPFFTTKFTGRGLGLAAVLGIMRGHRGAMKVSSNLGAGTTFTLLFPVTSGASENVRVEKPVGGRWRGEGTVLVVDDEAPVRCIARRMMEAMGFTVLTAADGRECVQIFRSEGERIRLVLLDMTMPHLDGKETFRELRRLQDNVKVILSSGYSEHTITSQFAGKGLSGYIQKPYRLEDLAEILRKVLEAESTNS